MFKLIISPRFAEMDGLGHLSNTTLPIWFEDAREPIFKLFNPEQDLKTWSLILARIEIDFTREIFYGSEVEIHTYIKHIGNSSFSVLQEAWQKGALAACGTAVMVHFDFSKKKSIPIPTELKEKLEIHKPGSDEIVCCI